MVPPDGGKGAWVEELPDEFRLQLLMREEAIDLLEEPAPGDMPWPISPPTSGKAA